MPRNGQRALLIVSLLALLPACAGRKPATYSGFVDAPVALVATQVSGQVASVSVREGQRVARGQLLAMLDARERAAFVAQADANLERAREALNEAEKNTGAVTPTVRGAEADIARQQAELDDALAEFDRVQRLSQSGAISSSQLDAARARLQQARAAVAAMGANRLATRARVDASVAAVRTARASVASSQAALELAQVQLAQAEIRSPVEGLVAEQNVQPGEWVAPGTPIFTVEDRGRQWVRIDVEETALGALRVGRAASIHVVAFPNRRYRGHVIEIGAEGEFALNRDVKRGRPDVRTFRVRVGLDEIGDELRPGMTAEIMLDAEKAR